MIPTSRDERDRLSRSGELGGGGDAKERSKIDEILPPRVIVAREHLQGDQMAGSRDGDRQVRQQFDGLGFGHHLTLDS